MEFKTGVNLGTNYLEHIIFSQLTEYINFYDTLSFSIMSFSSLGTKAVLNLDTYAYSSIKGTIESIKEILLKGRINDAYSLLRKYYDSTIINVYVNLFLNDHFNLENFIVIQIDNWRAGTEKIPEYRKIITYIKKSPKLKPITELLYRNDLYNIIRNRCNDNTHYNFYQNYLLNDNEIYNPNRIKYLDLFSKDIEAIFIQHFAYIFFLNEHYMASSDYIDSLELGYPPVEGSQNWVASFIQKIFDDVIKLKRPDIADEIKKHTSMELV
jgi:hypothetical protein